MSFHFFAFYAWFLCFAKVFQIELRLHLKGIVVYLMTCHCMAVLTFDQSVLALISKNIFESLFLVFFLNLLYLETFLWWNQVLCCLLDQNIGLKKKNGLGGQCCNISPVFIWIDYQTYCDCLSSVVKRLSVVEILTHGTILMLMWLCVGVRHVSQC